MVDYKYFSYKGPFGPDSDRSIWIDGQLWPTQKHYLVAHMFEDETIQEVVKRIIEFKELKDFIRRNWNLIRKDWNDWKEQYMYCSLRNKIEQHTDLHERLLSTGDTTLICEDGGDYWGYDNGAGENRLGELLMDLRYDLQKEEERKENQREAMSIKNLLNEIN